MGSIASQKYSSRRLEALYFAKEQLTYIDRNHPNIINSAKYRLFLECMNIVRDMPLNTNDRFEVKRTITEYRNGVMKDPKLSKKRKAFSLSAYFGLFGIKFAYFLQRLV